MKTEAMKAFTTEPPERTEMAQSVPEGLSSVFSVASVVNAFGCPHARNP